VIVDASGRATRLWFLTHAIREGTATMVQRPFLTSLSPLNNWFWNHNRLSESGVRREQRRGRGRRAGRRAAIAGRGDRAKGSALKVTGDGMGRCRLPRWCQIACILPAFVKGGSSPWRRPKTRRIRTGGNLVEWGAPICYRGDGSRALGWKAASLLLSQHRGPGIGGPDALCDRRHMSDGGTGCHAHTAFGGSSRRSSRYTYFYVERRLPIRRSRAAAIVCRAEWIGSFTRPLGFVVGEVYNNTHGSQK